MEADRPLDIMYEDVGTQDLQVSAASMQEIEDPGRAGGIAPLQPMDASELAAACVRCMIAKADDRGEDVKLSAPDIARCTGVSTQAIRDFLRHRTNKGQLERTDPPVWLEFRKQPTHTYYTLTPEGRLDIKPALRPGCPTDEPDQAAALANFREVLYAFPNMKTLLDCVRCQTGNPIVAAGEAPITTDSLAHCSAQTREQANRAAKVLLAHDILSSNASNPRELSARYFLTDKGRLVLEPAENPNCDRRQVQTERLDCECKEIAGDADSNWIKNIIAENYEETRRPEIRNRLRALLADKLLVATKAECQKEDLLHEAGYWHMQAYPEAVRHGRSLVPGERLLALTAREQRAFFHVLNCELLVYGSRMTSAQHRRNLRLSPHIGLGQHVESVIFPKIDFVHDDNEA